MRLMLVSARHHPSQGGIGAGVWWLTHHAMRAGWEIHLVTRASDVLPAATRVDIVHTPDERPEFARRIATLRRIEQIRPYRYGLWSLAVAEKLLELDADVDAIEFVDSQAEGLVALTSRLVRSRWPSVPMYVHAHAPMFLIEQLSGLPSSRFGRWRYHEWEQRAIAAADAVLAPSRRMIDALKPLQHCQAIPYLLPPLERDQTNASSRGGSRMILLVGNVEPNKGIDLWARSLNRVLSKHHDARAVLAGPDTPTGPDGMSMAEHAQSLIESSLRDRFTWIGPASHEQTQQLIAEASLVVVPSRFESFSFVAAESIAKHTPVIVSDRVGISDFVPAIPQFACGDVDALAELQLQMLGDEAMSRRAARECWLELQSNCDPQRSLEARAAFIQACRDNGAPIEQELDAGDQVDSMDVMRLLLASIERQETDQGLEPDAAQVQAQPIGAS